MRSLKLKATLLTNNCLALCISRTYFSHKSIAYLLLHTNSLHPYSYRGNSKKISIFLVSITDPFVLANWVSVFWFIFLQELLGFSVSALILLPQLFNSQKSQKILTGMVAQVCLLDEENWPFLMDVKGC
ncbi:hypothetical protein IMY05_012G0040500 [Salix suchowensis]|nr:hypothetical protein IMY05_012G0040500 [Salix suchowensis]